MREASRIIDFMKTAVSNSNFSLGQSWPQLVDSRWFALADLGLVTIAGGLWYLTRGGLGPWPLLLALLPWVARLTVGQFPWQRTQFDWLLGLFLLTAVTSFWTAYDQTVASGKWWIIIGAVLLYYALASQPAINLPLIVAGLGGTAVIIAIYFLLSHDWTIIPAKVALLNDLGLGWMEVRPTLNTHRLHPNVAGGLMALLTPFLLAVIGYAWREKQTRLLAVSSLGMVILAIGLLLTTSRGAWLALVAALLIWGLWLASERYYNQLHLSLRQTFLAGLFMFCCLGVSLLILNPSSIAAFINSLPGPAQAGTRFAIAQQTWDLIGSYPFIGAGLGSFPALYGRYIHAVPFYLIPHSHNVFLDMALEQGQLGLIIFVVLIGTAVWQLIGHNNQAQDVDAPLLTGSLLASFAVLILHGLVEDPLYGSRGLLLIFVNAGLFIALVQPQQIRFWQRLKADWVWQWLGATALFTLLLLAFVYRHALIASWQANLGIIQLAQLELADWPTEEWQTAVSAAAYRPARIQLEQAFVTHPSNRTASYHLGRLELLEEDFTSAIFYLERAYKVAPNHRGIRKMLGYSYLWSGQLNPAINLLSSLPEVREELAIYSWWWTKQGRDDLAQIAQQLTNQSSAEN